MTPATMVITLVRGFISVPPHRMVKPLHTTLYVLQEVNGARKLPRKVVLRDPDNEAALGWGP